MPTVRRTRTIAASAEDIWRVVSDPHHLPRWWPRVTRVEGVADGEFTEVMQTRKGKTVRADYAIVACDEQEGRVRWDQRIAGTPFAGVLSSCETELRLVPAGPAAGADGPAATEVTIELRQVLSQQSTWQPQNRFLRRIARPGAGAGMGGRLVRRAADKTIDEALGGLERISV